VKKISTEQRRVRLAARHRLARPVGYVVTAAAEMVGLHASDPATVYLSARARVPGFDPEDLAAALYDDRTLLRMLGMRRTMFVVPPDLAAVMQAACTEALLPPQRRRLARMLGEQGVTPDPEAWLDDVETRVLAALASRGEATATELTEDVPELATKLMFGAGKKWGGTVGVSTRVLFLLATAGLIVRGRPRGTWLSSQYRWALTAEWVGAPLPRLDRAAAQADLLERWLRTFGPGTLTDLKWWTGWTVRDTKAAMEAVGAVEVDLETGAGWVLPDDLEGEAATGDWVALLPALDPTVMGWKDRDWYLATHQAALFDRNGNAGPTVWCNGRIVGGWTQRRDGEVAVELLEDVGAEASAQVEVEAQRLQSWLGEVRITPRFRTPLDKRLAG
jgi:hypothetical protein